MIKWFVGFNLSFTLFFAAVSSAQSSLNLNQLFSDKLYLHVNMELSVKIIEVEPLKKFYQLNGYAAIWTTGGKPSPAALDLKSILLKADDWGLTASQYMNPYLTNLFSTVNEKNAVTLEVLLTDTYLRFAQDLMNGQILDPDLIDEDIKMSRKSFDIMPQLVQAAQRPETLSTFFESLTPQHEKYKNLVKFLRKLNALAAQKTWGDLTDPKIDLKPGALHKVLSEVKKRLIDLGYPISNQTPVYDAELQKAVARYAELNSLPQGTMISRSLFKSLSPSIQDRINKVKANLEKFRWFQQSWESRNLFVNLAFQEMQVTEGGKIVLAMKTVNGRPTRRTPTMRDEIHYLELRPTWTVPRSIAVKDKLQMLQKDPDSLSDMRIVIYDSQDNVVDPRSVSWDNYTPKNFNFTLVQQPGPQNALGLVKFHLTNLWDIYLHDTNEPYLMKESMRLRSSGCIRLERPFDFALYLLRDQPQWTVGAMKSQGQDKFKISLKQKLPVYLMYLTVDVTPQGEVRTALDEYGQDQRLIEVFNSRDSHEKF